MSIGDILGEHNKILIVEDDEIISQVIEWRLINLGYSVSGKAATGKDAITLTEETSPDAILMDIALKGETDGIETAKIIKKNSIFLSSFSPHLLMKRRLTE